MTPPPAPPVPPVVAPRSRPAARRPSGGGNGDVLGLGWLHGSLYLAVFRGKKMLGHWTAAGSVRTLEELAIALDEALVELKFEGAEAFLLLENDQFVHQLEATPAFSDSVARAYLGSRVQRYEKANAPMLWVSEPAAGLKKERSFILHMLPKSFYEALNRLLLERRLDLTRILPLVVPVRRELDRFPISKGRPVLVAVEAGAATVVMVAKVGGELMFARSILALWSADPARIGVEINRSLLYAHQQFGIAVERVWLLGQDNESTAEVSAKCGTGRQITVLPTTPVEWLQTVAKLSPTQSGNLVSGHLREKNRQQTIRRGLIVVCWLSLGWLLVDAWLTAQARASERHEFAELQASVGKMAGERERLLARNQNVLRDRALVHQVVEERLPAVPGKFAAYLASVLPNEVRLTDLTVKWEESTGGWSFRIEGTVEADDETAREIIAALQRQMAKSPLRIHFTDVARAVVSMPRPVGQAASDLQRLNLEGVMLEN